MICLKVTLKQRITNLVNNPADAAAATSNRRDADAAAPNRGNIMTLQAGDLVHLVDNVLEIDSYKSKMGDDANIITVSFSVKNKHAADDPK